MLFLKLSLWTAIAALYLGFSGVMGYLVRRVMNDFRSVRNYLYAVGFGSLLFLPSSILILRHDDWSVGLGVLLMVGGLTVAVLASAQPDWIPGRLKGRTFGHHYFAATMFLSAFWSLTASITSPTLAAPLLGIAAYSVGVASWNAAQSIN